MKESRETLWNAIYSLVPSIKEFNEPNRQVFNLPNALELAARECFIKHLEEGDDTLLVRKALKELLDVGYISHELKD